MSSCNLKYHLLPRLATFGRGVARQSSVFYLHTFDIDVSVKLDALQWIQRPLIPKIRDLLLNQSASVTTPASVLLDTHSLDVTMAESTLAFGGTMCLDDLGGGAVTHPQCATSIPIPAELAKAIPEGIEHSPSTQMTSTCPIADDSATGAFRGHVISRVADTAAASDVTTTRTPDAHFQTYNPYPKNT